MRTAPSKCCVAVPLLLLLSGEDGEGVGKQEGDAGHCWRLLAAAVRRRLLLRRCQPASRRWWPLAEKMYIENYIEITMSLCCKCGRTLRKKNL
jgi:hypothetical protein